MIAFALSIREREVAVRVLDGKSDAEIAADLRLSRTTVRWYLRRLGDRLPGSGARRNRIERHLRPVLGC